MLETRIISISTDAGQIAWRQRDRIEVCDLDGAPKWSAPAEGDFAFVGKGLWVLDDTRVRIFDPITGDERAVVNGLPGGRGTIEAVPSDAASALVRQGEVAFLVDAGAPQPTRQIAEQLGPVSLLIPLGGARVLTVAGERLTIVEAGRGAVKRLVLPAPGLTRAGASVLMGKAIALAVDCEDGAYVFVLAADGRLIHRVEIDAWTHCAFAPAAAKVFLGSDHALTGVDLRYGRRMETLELPHGIEGLVVHTSGTPLVLASAPTPSGRRIISAFEFRNAPDGATPSAASAPDGPAADDSPADAGRPSDDERDEPAPVSATPEVSAWAARVAASPEPSQPEPAAAGQVAAGGAGYATHQALLDDYSERMRLLLARYLATHHLWLYDDQGRHSNRIVSAKEVEAFLTRAAGSRGSIEAINQRLEEHWAELQRRVIGTPNADDVLPLELVRRRFGLSVDAMDCLMALFFVETNDAFARAFSHAWSDFTRKQITIGFLVELLGTSLESRTRVLEALDPDAPLRKLGLVRSGEGTAQSLVSTELRINRRVLWTLLRGPTWLIEHPEPFVRVDAAGFRIEELVMDADARRTVWRLLESIRTTRGPIRYQVTGPAGVGRRTLVRALAAKVSKPTVTVTLSADLIAQVAPRVAAAAVAAETLLVNGWVCVVAPEPGGDGDIPPGQPVPSQEWLKRFYTTLVENVRAVFVVGNNVLGLPDLDAPASPFVVPYPSADTQAALWTFACRSAQTSLPAGLDAQVLSRTFSLTAGSISASVKRAVQTSEATGLNAIRLDTAPLLRAVRHELSSRLGNEATRVQHHAKWQDIVLAPEAEGKVRDIIMFARHRKQVLQQWRLGEKISYGTALSAMFSGPPGTGKTMVAGVIAGELGLELYRIDLASILSRWVGETEKNLARLFDEAERGQAILLFDEADSLFAKRTAVNSVQDRYANVQTNFLLQRIETYEGIAILTTNFESSIDEAFMRRIRFRVKFDVPTEQERVRLWKSFLLPTIPVSEEIDWEHLARDYELSGGTIKNAVLRACIAAAEVGRGLTTRLLAACAEFELAESGRLVTERFRSATHAL